MSLNEKRANAAVVRFLQYHVVESKKQLRMKDYRGFSKTTNWCSWRRRRRPTRGRFVIRRGNLLRDRGRICERWVGLFHSLLKKTSGILDPYITKWLYQQRVVSVLGAVSTEEKVTTALKAMINAQAVASVGFPMKLLKLGLQQDRTIFLGIHRSITLI